MNVQQALPPKQKPKRARSFWIRLVIGLIALFCLIAGGFVWILNTERIISGDWSTILPIVFIILAVVFALFTWLFPFSPIDIEESNEKPSSTPHLQIPQPLPTGTPTQQQQTAQPQTLWNVPYQRNPFFTGREELIKRLHDQLTTTKAAALAQTQAISGLGGIGKTQIAVEYAYRHQDEYKAVLWTRAETEEILLSDIAALAKEQLLNLPQKDEQDQNLVVDAVISWLNTYTNWLLILDNVEDISMIHTVLLQHTPLPLRQNDGHILLTTRSQATGAYINGIEVGKMEADQGAHFLLCRAKRNSDNAKERTITKAISEAMDGLPLALDQAGAYIEETQCSFSHYFELYQEERAALLKRRGNLAGDHPDSVTATFLLSFEKVQQINPIAANILRLCAFLYSESIPEEIIIKGASELDSTLQSITHNPLELDEAFAVLHTYSLVRRNVSDQTLSMHRLVQAVLQDTMNKDEQYRRADLVVRAVNLVFPRVDYTTWSQCQRYLPQALNCAALIETWKIESEEAMQLLYSTAYYLYERARYAEAQPLFKRALGISEQVFGRNHSNTAACLNGLAGLYITQGKYSEAEPLLNNAVAIFERTLGPDHPSTAQSLNNLAGVYHHQGKFEQAESLYQRALDTREKVLGPEHLDTTQTLNNLAELYRIQGKYELAEPLFNRALATRKKVLGTEHPVTSNSLHNLAELYRDQGKYEEAEPLYKEALDIRERTLGLEHPDTTFSLNNLAGLYYLQRKYEQTEPLILRALTIREQLLGPDHPDTARSMNNLAGLYYVQRKYEQAGPLYQQALTIFQKTLPPEHPDIASTLYSLAVLYAEQGKYEQAEPLYKEALTISQKTLPPEHPDIAATLHALAILYAKQGKYEQAEPLYQQALTISQKTLPPEHPDIAASLHQLALLYWKQGKYEQAEPLFKQAIAIDEKVLGPEHPDTITMQKNYTSLLETMKQ